MHLRSGAWASTARRAAGAKGGRARADRVRAARRAQLETQLAALDLRSVGGIQTMLEQTARRVVLEGGREVAIALAVKGLCGVALKLLESSEVERRFVAMAQRLEQLEQRHGQAVH